MYPKMIDGELRFQFFKFPMVQGPNQMFHLYLSRTVTMFSVFAMVSLVSGVTYGQSGSTAFGGATRLPTPAFGGGSSTTQFGGGSGTTQFGGGSATTTNFGGGSATTNSLPGQSFAPSQGCSSCGQTTPAAPAFDCASCGLPPAPAFNNCGWNYPQLQRGSKAVFPRRPRGRTGCCN